MPINHDRTATPPPSLPKSWLIVPPSADPAAIDAAGASRIVVDLCGPEVQRNGFGSILTAWRPLASSDGRLAARLPPAATDGAAALVELAIALGASTVLLAGARHGADVQHCDVLLQIAEARARMVVGGTRIVALAGDNPQGLLEASSFAGKSRRLVGLGWDASALSAKAGALDCLGEDVAATARGLLVLGAGSAGLRALDTADDESDRAAFEDACRHARLQGLGGKMTRQPWQVPVIERIFS